jgi:hypothetical protein
VRDGYPAGVVGDDNDVRRTATLALPVTRPPEARRRARREVDDDLPPHGQHDAILDGMVDIVFSEIDLIEFTTEHVLRPGYDFADSFESGLDLILDGLAPAAQRVLSSQA